MSEFLESYYDLGKDILIFLGGGGGQSSLGYEIVNILIFIFVQPGLIILFYYLWQKEKKNSLKK
tara:strand:- start:949 stop:1140 length:192 start_codon:yes stop_codon:yes gene_type:complete